MDERPKYKMRFVGYDANGELKPTAPAYKKHEVRELPLEYAQDFWWELVDAVPDLVIPEPRYEDSVFIEEVFVPHDDEAPTPPPEDKPLSLKEFAPAVKNGYFGEKWEESVETYGRDVDEGESPIDAEDKTPWELRAGEVITSYSVDLGDLFTVKVEPSLDPGEAFVIAPDAISTDTIKFDTISPEMDEEKVMVMSQEIDVDPNKVVKIKGLDESKVIDDTLALLTLGKMTVKELKDRIKELGGEVDSQWRKADLIREARKLEESSSLT